MDFSLCKANGGVCEELKVCFMSCLRWLLMWIDEVLTPAVYQKGFNSFGPEKRVFSFTAAEFTVLVTAPPPRFSPRVCRQTVAPR